MSETTTSEQPQLRLLVAIASYGNTNLRFLKRIIASYQQMSFQTDIVVLSESPKDLGADVTVRVGLPAPNPWSLPFAHKTLFAEKLSDYDLFIYSEDDMDVSEDNIRAFLRVSKSLNDDEIAGFLRYETDTRGTKLLTDVHDAFHWDAESVRRRGRHIVAEFTNEHAAFFILTRKQLAGAIASGGFLRDPCEGRYDMLCTAATDPYTNCGYHKVVCISELESFLINHLPNRYVQQSAVPIDTFLDQVRTLKLIAAGRHPATSLGIRTTQLKNGQWSKSYYEPRNETILALAPDSVQTVLSIGCGSGETESALVDRGCSLTALPLDSVIGAVAAHKGIRIIDGSWMAGFEKLGTDTFDCVLISNLLHLIEFPEQLIYMAAARVKPGGTLLAMGPNFNKLSFRLKRVLAGKKRKNPSTFETTGLSVFSVSALQGWSCLAGLRPEPPVWNSGDRNERASVSGAVGMHRKFRSFLGRILSGNGRNRFTANAWIVSCIRERAVALESSRVSPIVSIEEDSSNIQPRAAGANL